jgi:hypothetical protein
MRRALSALLIGCLLLSIGVVRAQIALPAFPGAEGFGAVATGGRGGRVITVTTLAPSGPGSLQAALDEAGPRTIVFAVSGLIPAVANIVHGDVTIAGQTSPGGIIVRGIVCDGHYEVNDCDNLIIRHLRSRPAPHLLPAEGFYDALDDALRLDGVENVMIDHLSLANATDEAVQISLARNVTIQNTLLAETVGWHAQFGGMLINYSHSQRPQDNLSIHHNLWNRIGGRTPEIACELTRGFGDDDQPERPSFCGQQPLNIELNANLLWDPGAAIWYGDNASADTPDAGIFTLNLNWINNRSVTRADFGEALMVDAVIDQPGNRLFFSGNVMDRYPGYRDLDLVYCCNDFALYHPNTEPPAAQMLAERHPFPPITTTPPDALIDYMLANVGAFPRDPMDRRLLAPLASGIIDPTPRDRPAADDAFDLDFDPANPPPYPTDSDGDGMPDDWERAHGLDPALPDHNGFGLSPEGYTNLEVYLNELADLRVRSG